MHNTELELIEKKRQKALEHIRMKVKVAVKHRNRMIGMVTTTSLVEK